MSRSESRMSDGSRARSHYWVMTVMMVGLVGCHRSPRDGGAYNKPARDADALNKPARNPLALDGDHYRCRDGGPDTPSFELDGESDGGVGAAAGCVDPGGTVTFKSECDAGTVTFTVTTDGGVFKDGGTACSPIGHGSVTNDGGTYTITLPNLGDSCHLGIAQSDGGAEVPFVMNSACKAPSTSIDIEFVTPIKGTLEVATSGPGEDDKVNAGQR